jgi:hypothetical protein
MDLGPGWKDTTARLQQVYDRAADISVERVLTPEEQQLMLSGAWYGGANERNGDQRRSIHLADTRGILNIPASQDGWAFRDPYNPTDTRGVPSWFPTLNNSAPVVSLTPQVLNREAVSTTRLENLYVDGWSAVFQYLRDRNCVMKFHPAVMGALQNFQVPFNYNSSYNPAARAALQNWYQTNGNVNYLVQSSVMGMTIPDGDPNQGPRFGGINRGWWITSLDRRVPIIATAGTYLTQGPWQDSETKISTPVEMYDALLEVARLLNVMKVLLETGNANLDARATMVDLFAAQAVYGGVQVLAYQQIGRTYGENVLGYRANMAIEVAARRNQSRTDAIGVPGYHSSGDDAADIAMGLVGCVAVAVSAAVSTGNVFVGIGAFVLAAARFLVAWVTMPEAPRNPYDLPIRLGGVGTRTPQAFGISVNAALETPPAFRVNGR